MQPKVLPGRVSSRALRRLLFSGIIAGFLLTPLAPAFPERAQSPGLYGGIALSLVCIAMLLAQLARGTRLEWREVSPAVGILIGAVLFIAPASWHYLVDRRGEASRTPPTAVSAAAPATLAGAATPVQTGELPTPQNAGSQSPSNPPPADQLLDELSAIFAVKARPTIQAVIPMTLTARVGGASGARSRLATITTGVADLQRSLDRIRSENPSRRDQLDALLGDTTALNELNSALQRYSDTLQGLGSTSVDETSAQALTQLRAHAADALRWMHECEGRLAVLKAPGVAE
jgi:hypothetical protein